MRAIAEQTDYAPAMHTAQIRQLSTLTAHTAETEFAMEQRLALIVLLTAEHALRQTPA